MDKNRWQSVKEIFNQALELPADKRHAYVIAKSEGDIELQESVLGMLKAEEENREDTHSVTHLISSNAQTLLDNRFELKPGDKIDAYVIDGVIGEGGMGSVYLASRADKTFEQQVAIKLVHSRNVTRESIERFRLERQILASFSHPNIASLIGGGETEDQMPYIVLEYVKGINIIDYCKQQKLGLKERLALFRKVLSAISYAHQNLVVHRDIKPSNVLINEHGGVKLLDFGIAKLLDTEKNQSDLELTREEMRILTPGSASPEQVLGGTITTRSDIYGLGTLLYQMLTEQPVFETQGVTQRQVEDLILTANPAKPSKVCAESEFRYLRQRSNGIKGDLDTIVLTALQKDPDRRYDTSQLFEQDIERYLTHYPILAKPDSLAYVFGKFIRRNAIITSVGSVFVVALMIFSIVLSQQSNVIQMERDKALSEAIVSKQVSDFMVEMFEAADPNSVNGDKLTANELVVAAADRLKKLEMAPAIRARLTLTLGSVYRSIGDLADAKALLDEASQFYVSNAEASDKDLGEVNIQFGHYYYAMGDYLACEKYFRSALMHFSAAMEATSSNTDRNLKSSLYESRYGIAVSLGEQGKNLEALALFEKQQNIFETDDSVDHHSLADFYLAYGHTLRSLSRFEDSATMLEKGVEFARKNFGNNHLFTGYALNQLASTYHSIGKFSQALPLAYEGLEIRKKQHKDNNPEIAASLGIVSRLHAALGDLPKAIEAKESAMQVLADSVGKEHTYYGGSMSSLASLYFDHGKLDVANEYFQSAEGILSKALPPGHIYLSLPLIGQGRVALERQNYSDAVAFLEQAHTLLKPNEEQAKKRYADASAYYSVALYSVGELNKASSIANESLAIYGDLFGEDSDQYMKIKKLVENSL